MDQDVPNAEALAVKGEYIMAVGSDSEILDLTNSSTVVVDLGGRTLLPGFVDTHNHLFNDARNYLGMTLEEAQELALRGGTTTIADMFIREDFLRQMQSFDQQGKLHIRTSLYLVYTDNCGRILGDWYRNYPPVLDPSKMLRIPRVKIFSDGGSCRQGAYSFDLPEWNVRGGPRGDLFLTVEQLAEAIIDIQAHGYQVAVHAIGDRAIETVLNSFEIALAGEPNTYRHRMEHNWMIRPDLLPRFGEIGVLPSIWGQTFTCWILDNGQVGPRGETIHPYGEMTHSWTNPVRSLLDANPGLPIAWQSDLPWVGEGPITDLYSLVTRKEIRDDGTEPCEPPNWLEAEAIAVEEALRMMTINGAHMLFMEDTIGSLTSGKFADMVVLSDNPLEVDHDSLKDLEVLSTIIGGRVEYCAPGQEQLCSGVARTQTLRVTPQPTPVSGEPDATPKASPPAYDIFAPGGMGSDCDSDPNPRFTAHITDLSKISSLTPAGTVQAGDLKPHGYLHNVSSNPEVPVYAPVDSYLIDFAHYEGYTGVGHYTFKFQVSCEVAYYFDHLRSVVDKIGNIAPELPSVDSHGVVVWPPILFQAGELIGYTGGNSVFVNWDFGVLNTETWNPLPTVPYVYSPNVERYRFAVCPYEYFDEEIQAEYMALLGDQGCGP